MKSIEKKLLKYFSRLTEAQQQTLLQFAEFLAARGDSVRDAEVKKEIPKPIQKQRPAEETVVGAIKRLTASYPMLGKDKLFNETSVLMTRHVMQGHAANLIIDELESLFRRHYEALINEQPRNSEE
ncbi:MAG TPA: Crp/Fnr family transcriptional regulator [Gammaproteobacteria bacterium]